jgi:membrane protease YdiL (CAAX protease family)
LLKLNPVYPKIDRPRRSAICALMAVSASMLVVMLLIMSLGSHQHAATHSALRRYNLMPQLFLVVLYCLPMTLMLRLNRETLRSTGLTTSNFWKATVVGLFLAAATLVMGHGGPGAALRGLDSQRLQALLYFGIVGFGEEFLFRGYLQSRMVAWLGQMRGWVLASVIMALAHLPVRILAQGMDLPHALASSAALIFVSLLCGFVMLRTGNVVAPALFHAFADWPHH